MDTTLGGFDTALLIRAVIILAFVLLVLRIVFKKGTGRGAASLFAVRYSLLIGAFVLAMPLIFLRLMRQMFGTTYVLNTWGEVTLVTFFYVTLAWVVMATWFITQRRAPERLPDLEPLASGGDESFAEWVVSRPLTRLLFTTVLAVPSVLATVASTSLGKPAASPSELFASLFTRAAAPNLLAAGVGLLFALALLYLNYSVFRVIDDSKAASFELFTDFFANPALSKAQSTTLKGKIFQLMRTVDGFLMRIITPIVLGVASLVRLLQWPCTMLGRWIAKAADFQFTELGPGYFEPGTDELYQEHRFAQLQLGVLGVVYVASGLYFSPFFGGPSRYSLPVIGYIAILFMILAYGLSGIAFFLDRWRVPTTIAVAAGIYFMGLFPSIDHLYKTSLRAECGTCDWEPLTSEQAIAGWWNADAEGCDANPPLIAVAASGGGIRAGAWTVEVLTALEEVFGQDFTRSFGAISSVSGGSVGTVQYLLDFPECGQRSVERMDEIRRDTAANSLRATAWGIVYPDFLRLVLAPVFEFSKRAEHLDRASAMEAAWRRNLEESLAESTLGSWRSGIRRGVRPIALINTTTVETGETFVMTPIDIDRTTQDSFSVPSFFNEYPDHDVNALTAARMSATFPWVSPVARPNLVEGAEAEDAGSDDAKTGPRTFYLADGGYVDNFGIATLIRWLSAIIPSYASLGSTADGSGERELLVLLIRDSTPVDSNRRVFRQERGLRNAVFGPIDTMLNARGSTQNARNAQELLLFEELWGPDAKQSVQVNTVSFQLANKVAREVSLSWMLTDQERALLTEDLCRLAAEAQGGGSEASENPFTVVGDFIGVDTSTLPLPARCDALAGEDAG